MKFKEWFPKTYFGFPVDPSPMEGSACQHSGKSAAPSRGIAMMIAIMVIATMLIFTADMMVNSTVSVRLNESARDGVKAEYMAKSALNLGIFLVTLDLAVDIAQYQYMKKLPKDGRGEDEIYNKLNNTPISEDLAQLMKLSKVNDSGIIEQLKLFDSGGFQLEVEDEMSRINANACTKGRGEYCLPMLELLMSGPAERSFLDKKKVNGKLLAANIKDWVDSDNSVEPGAGRSGESDPYDDREPKIKPKNAPFDSLDELKIVEGWDDDIHAVFSPYITVFPVPPDAVKKQRPIININTAKEELLRNLLHEGTEGCGKNFSNLSKPQEDIDVQDAAGSKEIESTLSSRYCVSDKTKTKWFTYRSDVFRIRAIGSVREHKKLIEAVIQRGYFEQKTEGGTISASELPSTYKILYWKMI